MPSDSPFVITLSLNVLYHLGINLYSNASAVLSEVVANSYDADAENVWITIDKTAKEVTIRDDGTGMTKEEVNGRFLHVGYKRRVDDTLSPLTAKFKRKVMGRKGIGKLSLFSIAKIVEVYTVTTHGERVAFRMSLDDIEKAIKEGANESPASDDATESGPETTATSGSTPEERAGKYRPEPIDTSSIDFEHGTKIVLRELKRAPVNVEAGLRKRLARRFSILGSEYNFQLSVNNEPVTPEDRDYYHLLEYVWSYQDEHNTEKLFQRCKNATHSENIGPGELDGNEVTGWIGTARSSADLKPPTRKEAGANRVTLMVRGKLAHEDLLKEIDETSVFRSYLVGEIRADFLDLDDQEDIATSSRQGIKEEDPRYEALIDWLRDAVRKIGSTWTRYRNEEGTSSAFRSNPAIEQWFDTLGKDTRKKAKALFGKINQLTVDSDDQKAELFSHAVLAFETMKYRDNLDKIEDWGVEQLSTIGELFSDIEQLEAALYYQIVTQRLQVVKKLRDHTEDNALERVLQEHLFKNLWLLDPAWERATDVSMEKKVGSEFKDIDAKLTDDERKARWDIRFQRFAGANVIVELKRASVATNTDKLVPQVRKYRNAVRKHLESIGDKGPIEIVCVVGKDLTDWSDSNGRKESAEALKIVDARVVTYEELLTNAVSAYGSYLDRQAEEVGRIRTILDALGKKEDE